MAFILLVDRKRNLMSKNPMFILVSTCAVQQKAKTVQFRSSICVKMLNCEQIFDIKLFGHGEEIN